MNRKRTRIIILWIIAVLLLASCGGNPGNSGASPQGNNAPSNAGTPTASGNASPEGTALPQPDQTGSGTIGSHKVSILDYKLAEDFEGNPAAVITYEWTNNSDETMNFMFAFQYQLFQNGVECQAAILTDTEGYDADTQLTDIRPGATLTVQTAFTLKDTENPVEVEVSELMSLESNPPVVKKTFTIV